MGVGGLRGGWRPRDGCVLRADAEQAIKGLKDHESTEAPTSPPGAKRAVQLALELMIHMNHEFVGCEHFLLSLIQQGDGLAAQILKKHGVTIEAATAAVVKLREDGR